MVFLIAYISNMRKKLTLQKLNRTKFYIRYHITGIPDLCRISSARILKTIITIILFLKEIFRTVVGNKERKNIMFSKFAGQERAVFS